MEHRPERPWLADKIAAAQRRAKLTACKRCGAKVLRGLDDDVAALDTTVDAEPVSAAGELAAIADGLRTYELYGDDLSYRTLYWHVRYASETTRPVHVEHRCPEKANVRAGAATD